jgi:hypothetical protein
MIEVGVKQGGKIKVRTRKKPYYTKEEFEEAVKGVRKASLMYCVPRAIMQCIQVPSGTFSYFLFIRL